MDLPIGTVFDACGRSLGRYDITTSEIPKVDVLTLQPVPGSTPIAQAFDFSDIPCPPPAIQKELDPGYRYSPVVYIGSSIPMMNTSADGSLSSMECDILAMMDPPEPAYAVDYLSNDGSYFVGPPDSGDDGW